MKLYHLIIQSLIYVLLSTTSFSQPQSFNSHCLHVEAGYYTTTSLVFPFPIEAADYGSGELLVKPMDQDARVLKIKALKKDFNPTNITVITEEGTLYSVPIVYSDSPDRLIYNWMNKNDFFADSCVLPSRSFNRQSQVEQFCKMLSAMNFKSVHGEFKMTGGRSTVTKYKMVLSCKAIIIKDNLLYFAFNIQNRSAVPYDIYLTRFYIRDITRSKKTSYLEKEIHPVYRYLAPDHTVNEDSASVMVVAFDKFTIADSKLFCTEVSESNGDRFLKLNLKGRNILNAANLNSK